MQDEFGYVDELGPFKVIHVYEPSVNLKGALVIDNVARGPSIGGIRVATDVCTEECIRLARAMTLKNAAADLPHGGGKAVIWADPKMNKQKKEQLIRAFACALREMDQYILAPDMGTDEQCMAWIKDEINRVVGLPRELGGIPLDEIGATGWGLRHVTEVTLDYLGLELTGLRLAVQGFGAVGQHTARFLVDQGASLVAVADSRGTLYEPNGLNVQELIVLKQQGKSVIDYAKGQHLSSADIVEIECDIWIPAARPDVIHENNVDMLNTHVIIEGANIPITAGAEQQLHEKGVLCIPDFIANAGGVICAAMEYRGASESAVFEVIENKLRRNTQQLLESVRLTSLPPRQAALELALERVKKAMALRRWPLFSKP